MPKLPSTWVWPSLFLLALLPLQACSLPLTYSAKAVHGRVVDAETKEPLAGVVVVANWPLYEWRIGGHGSRTLHFAEALTDEGGAYSIDGWGPKLRPPETELDTDPNLVMFKSGYEPRFLANDTISDASVRVSQWNGKTIDLRRFGGSSQERLRQLEMVVSYGGPGGRSGFPRRLCDELLNERSSIGRNGDAFFANVEDLRREGQ